MKILIVSMIGAAAFLGCPPNPPVPPQPDADAVAPPPPIIQEAGSDCTAACAALAAIGCSIGSQPGCPLYMQTVNDTGKVPDKTGHPVTCAEAKAVKTKSDAQNLGFVCAP